MNLLLLFLYHLSHCLLHAQAYSDPAPPEFDEEVDNGSQGFYPTKSFVTEEEKLAPLTNFVRWSPQCDDGLLYFVTPRGWSLPTPGPMILDSRGELVWGHHFENGFGGQAYNFMVQTYQGQEYLTFWLGDDRVRGHGAGSYYMLNASYDIVHKVSGANGLHADLHEFLITDNDTALISIYDVIPADVTRFRDFNPEEIPEQDQNFVWDCAFQEVDIRTGELIFEWRASDHVDIAETYRDIYDGGHMGDPWDWYHINSIDKDEAGNYLVSARYPQSIAYIDGRTKETLWQLGGKQNDFLDLSDGQVLNFAWQHDARLFSPNAFPNLYTPPPTRPGFTTQLLTLFDNAAEDQHYEYGTERSRGLLIELIYPTPGTEPAATRPAKNPATHQKQVQPAEDEEIDWNGVKVQNINRTNPDWTARLIKLYENPSDFRSSSQGSMQVIEQDFGDPKIFLGYGLNAAWTEFDANGSVLCDVHFGARTSWERGDVQSYRAYKMAWTGRPETRPSVEISDDDEEVYVSWNGATDVVDWILQCSDRTAHDDDGAWADAARVRKESFETTIAVPDDLGDARYLRVMALAANGRRLDYGVSEIIDRGMMAPYFSAINRKLPSKFEAFGSTKIFLTVVLNVSLMFIFYEVYRRYLSWRRGRPGAGPRRWRAPAAVRVLGDA